MSSSQSVLHLYQFLTCLHPPLYIAGITLGFHVDGPLGRGSGGRSGPQWDQGAMLPVLRENTESPPSENGFNRIETPSDAYPETYFADSSLGLDPYFN